MNLIKFNFLTMRKQLVLSILFVLILGLNGCAWLNPFADSVKEYNLDNKYQIDVMLMPGESVALDMRNPGAGGYMFSGASFNPEVLNLEYFHILKPDSDRQGDFGRWRFVFKALKVGEDVITIHINRPSEKMQESYKIIQIKVTKDGEPFIKW